MGPEASEVLMDCLGGQANNVQPIQGVANPHNPWFRAGTTVPMRGGGSPVYPIWASREWAELARSFFPPPPPPPPTEGPRRASIVPCCSSQGRGGKWQGRLGGKRSPALHQWKVLGFEGGSRATMSKGGLMAEGESLAGVRAASAEGCGARAEGFPAAAVILGWEPSEAGRGVFTSFVAPAPSRGYWARGSGLKQAVE
ncbi:unnamed protein product, partial [Discosporangium mesarthrocarpum]